MKTPKEINKSLRMHFMPEHPNGCTGCAYKDKNAPGICMLNLYKDTKAYIQQLESQVPKWISVEERLPKNFQTVIIWRNDCHVATIGWLIDDSWSVPKGVNVTHWMPLPEPPKEDDA